MATTAIRPAKRAHRATKHLKPAPAPLDPTPRPTEAVQHTTNYGAFRSITSNREVDETHVKRLMESIRKENLLHLRPLDVTADFGVIDGQHRLEAAERLGVPVYYQMGQLNQGHIAVLNSVSKHWNSLDYLNFFTLEGHEEYKKVSAFVSKHPKIPFSATLCLLSESSRGNLPTFKAGGFRVSRAENAHSVATYCADFAERFPHFKFAFTDTFVKGLDMVVRSGQYSHERMLRKIDLQPRMLVRCPSVLEYVKLLEELNNYNAAPAQRVRFR
ncbi:ParB N-terminal domain-containing protein [Hymenobacter nivis]|nr:ParB N-terminal domain-containing protein [Hymenobacter nivis]